MLSSFTIENFKSYREATLKLAPLTVLIGANASGKSNAIEGLRLLSWIAEGKRLGTIRRDLLEKERAIRGNVGDLAYRGALDSPLSDPEHAPLVESGQAARHLLSLGYRGVRAFSFSCRTTDAHWHELDVPGFNRIATLFWIGSANWSTPEPTSCSRWAPSWRPATTSPTSATAKRRRRHATVFADQVRKALKGEVRWALAPLPDADELVRWLDTFPDEAMRGLGMVDLSIVKEWDRSCRRHPHRRVSVWSLDRHLAGYDRVP